MIHGSVHGAGDVRFVSIEGLNAGCRQVAPDFIVASDNLMLKRRLGMNEARQVWMALCEGRVDLHPKLLADPKQNLPARAERTALIQVQGI